MEYLNEQQQVEQLKALWKEYGVAVILGVVIAILVVLGMRYYHRYEAVRSEEASMMYTSMMNSVLSQDTNDAQVEAKQLIKTFPHSPYALIAQLWLAKQAVAQQNYTGAQKSLEWVIEHGHMSALRQVARIRSAQIALEQKNTALAIQTLSTVENKAYIGLVDEVRGDAYLQMNDTEKARAQYQLAWKEIPNPTQTQPLLAMKLADLPVAAQKE